MYMNRENCPNVTTVAAIKKLKDDDNGPTILKSKLIKAIKVMRRKKAIWAYNIPVDLLKELEENGLKIITILVNKIYMSGN